MLSARGGGSGPAWALSRNSIRIGEKRVFAPANLRAAAENEPYRALVDAMVGERYTLRYSGGLVPDIHHILAKARPARSAQQLLHACMRWRHAALHGRPGA